MGRDRSETPGGLSLPPGAVARFSFEPSCGYTGGATGPHSEIYPLFEGGKQIRRSLGCGLAKSQALEEMIHQAKRSEGQTRDARRRTSRRAPSLV